jgi:hypothetical protein
MRGERGRRLTVPLAQLKKDHPGTAVKLADFGSEHAAGCRSVYSGKVSLVRRAVAASWPAWRAPSSTRPRT